MALCPLQQFHAPADGQHAAQRELVRWRHVCQADALVLRQAGAIQAMFVHGRGQARGAGRLEAAPGHQVAGVFKGEGIAGIQQQPRAQVNGLLRAIHHHDLPGLAGKPAGPSQIALQSAAQRRVAFRRRIAEAVLLAQQFGLAGTPPGQRGEIPRRHRAVAEVEAKRFRVGQ
ncbi:hypothetical protein D3C81_1462110 [compost metagenome]